MDGQETDERVQSRTTARDQFEDWDSLKTGRYRQEQQEKQELEDEPQERLGQLVENVGQSLTELAGGDKPVDCAGGAQGRRRARNRSTRRRATMAQAA